MTEATRSLVVWCADWPMVAAGKAPEEPAVAMYANRVVACTPAARAEGVRRGLRRREAQARCPEVTILAADPDRDARSFEPVAAAVETMAPLVEIVRPGVLVVPARGPSRYFGGDQAAADRAADLASAVVRTQVGAAVADGLVAAILAARTGGRVVIPPGESAAFLAAQPIDALGQALPDAPVLELTEVFRRLGLRRLGDVAALPPVDLVGRFGPLGGVASRLARGLDERPPRPRRPDPDLTVASELEPPADKVETAAFLARMLAAELCERLSSRGLMCTRIAIEVETEHGETLSRRWRHEGGLGPAALADRVRWQLDGWLNRATWGTRPTGGIALLRLVPEEVVADDGRQLSFWGGGRATDERAARGVARLQGLLGPDAVTVPERRGGRDPGDRAALVPAHAVRLGAPLQAEDADRPWPGHLPPPAPGVVHPRPLPAEVLDAGGQPVQVSGRGLMSAEPAAVRVPGRTPSSVAAWCGPWPVDERWWDRSAHRRRARIQVVTDTGDAHLLALEGGRWVVEATYD